MNLWTLEPEIVCRRRGIGNAEERLAERRGCVGVVQAGAEGGNVGRGGDHVLSSDHTGLGAHDQIVAAI